VATVVTANFGGFDDPPHPPAEQYGPEVRWLYYTDSKERAEAPWVTVKTERRYSTPNLSAKWFKCCPPVPDADVIWIDANMEITSPRFVREALTWRHDGLAVWKHPRRSCVYAEADASVGAESQGGKYDAHAIAAQMASYLAEGHPANGGLYACGTVAWDLADGRARQVGELWFAECLRWSPQDQLSLPVVCRRLGVVPGVFPHRQTARYDRLTHTTANRWLRIHAHRAAVSA
jgi:hypothetical protein